MKVAVIGATGNAGQRIVRELRQRDHDVTRIARTIDDGDGVAVDAADTAALADALRGHDAVVSSVKFKFFDTQLLIDAVRASGVRRYVVVGGAGTLWVAPGMKEGERPDFPEMAKEEVGKGARFLGQLREVEDLDWTFLSPSREFVPGERTGKFRIGTDDLLFWAEGRSGISYEDYAVALVDELETPAHIRTRFTVGY